MNGSGNSWLYGGGPSVWGTRISGAAADPSGPGGYPNPNYAVHDLRDNNISPGNTYTYTAKYRPLTPSSNTYSVTVTAANCGGAPTPPPTPGPTPTPPPGAGVIRGVCRWVGGAPEVQMTWSQFPPPGQGAANSNSLQKGDFYPTDPNQYWGFLPNNPAVYAYNDSSVILNTQYQYRVKYRTDLPSLNIYNIYVSAQNCGGPPPPPGPLVIAPSFQTLPPNVTAFLTVTGGNGTYAWSAPTGTVNGGGTQIGVTYTNASTQPVSKIVTATSGSQTANAEVQVDGVETLQDSIDLSGPGRRSVVINDDAPVTEYFDVGLTLQHGFSPTASDSLLVQISNTLEGAPTATQQPYAETVPWNLCDAPGYCTQGPFTVYAIYTRPSGEQSLVVMDNIIYSDIITNLPPSVEINGGDATTDDRLVALTLEHGFEGIPPDQIGMQIANRADLVDAADTAEFTPALIGWDVCSGLGPTCPNGTRTVFVKFCAQSQCTTVAQDAIQLTSAWPEWGIRVNNDAAGTATTTVQLNLNPYFNRPGTRMLVSNLPDFSDAATRSFALLVPWDLCLNRVPCVSDTYPVYVRFMDETDLSYPEPESPRYEDVIALTISPTPTPAAAILLDDGAALTTDRIVSVRFSNPFGIAAGVSLRAINDGGLTQRDRTLITTEYGGGVEGQPRPQQPGTSELESATVRSYTDLIASWDLCGGAELCPFGTYKVLAQFYRTPTAGSTPGTLAAIGDEVSWVYFDTIVFGAPTPTPSSSVLPTPTGSVGPTPTMSGGPITTGGPTTGQPCTGIGCVFQGFSEAFAGAEPVLAPLAIVSAIVVALSAVVTLLPLIGPGLISFAWQWLMGIMGLLPARKKMWGTVYDSATKRPIAYAKVQLLDRNRRVLETRVGDNNGRYGFLTTPESLQAKNTQIYILPIAQGYAFPSHAPESIDRFVYNNLYRGDLISVEQKELINYDVPMDPLKQKTSPLLQTSPSIALGAAVAAMADAGFWLGLIIVPLNFLVNPNPFTFGTMCLFLGTASLRLFGISEHPFGTVSDGQTGRAMPYALLTLNDMSGKRIAFAVSDEQGRYFMVVPPGSYELIAFTPAIVQPTRQAKQTIEVKKGWVTRSIKL